MRVRPFIAFIADEEGNVSELLFEATSRRRVKRDVRAWVERTDWGATIVAIEPAVARGRERRDRRLLRVAGITFTVSGLAIAAMMVIGLSLEGGL
jgi:hypothetical protein